MSQALFSPAEERKRKASSAGLSLLIVALLALGLWFIRLLPPDPPLSAGVEVNFGFDEAGFGTVSTYEAAGGEANPPTTETEIGEAQASETTSNTSEGTATSSEDNLATSDNPDSPLEVPDKPSESAPAKKSEPNPEPKKDSRDGAKPAGSGAKAEGTGKANDGNKPGATGNQGLTSGDINNLNYDGNGGKGGAGASLDMSGWKWDSRPAPEDRSEENGKIVFEVKVDENGDILSVRTLEKTVSPSVERVYREEVLKLTFSRTKDNRSAAPVSVGRITFLIRAK